MSDTPETLDVEWGRGSVEIWAARCVDTLNDAESLGTIRKFVRRYKRKGGEGGAPGDFDELFDNLVEFFEDEEEAKEEIKEALESGTEEWPNFDDRFNSMEQDTKVEFIKTLNKIGCFPPFDSGE